MEAAWGRRKDFGPAVSPAEGNFQNKMQPGADSFIYSQHTLEMKHYMKAKKPTQSVFVYMTAL